MTNYQISEKHIEILDKQLAKLSKRAVKLGTDPIGYTVAGEKFVETESGSVKRFVIVDVFGTNPAMNGWSLVAVNQHIINEKTGANENIIRALPFTSIEIPEEFRHTDALRCDHCESRRQRNDTYIVAHPAEGFRQVGSTCLNDFVGSKDAQKIAQLLEDMQDAIAGAQVGEEGGDEGFGGGEQKWFSTKRILTITAAVVRRDGYVSRKKAQLSGPAATADIVLNQMFPSLSTPKLQICEADSKLAEDSLLWAREQGAAKNEYLLNVYAATMNDFTSKRNVGIIASIPAAYDGALVRKAEQQKLTNKFVGTVGEKLVKSIKVVSEKPMPGYGPDGVTTLYTMQDEDGNTFKWFSSKPVLTRGESYKLQMKVKKHDSYNGYNTTLVYFCKVL